MNAIKKIICALMLVLLIGCTGVADSNSPADVTRGDEAQLEGVDTVMDAEEPAVEPEAPVQEQEPAQEEHMFDKAIELLKTKTVSYEDDTGNRHLIEGSTMTIWLEDTKFLRTDFAMDTVILDLQSRTAKGACDETALRNYAAGELCERNTEGNTALSFEEYFVKTPAMWLEEYKNKAIARTQENIFCQGSMTTLVEFENGDAMWLNYKGVPIKIRQGENVINFFDVQLA